MRAVDLDLFVNSASKGWQDGAKVASPFAAFLQGVSDGIDQNFKNDQLAAQTEKIRIENEQEPYRDAILEAEAEKAKIQTQAMQENPDAFKDSIIKKAEADRAAKDQAAAYEMKKTKLTEIWNSGNGEAIGEAYISREYKDVFLKDKALDEQFSNPATFATWGKNAQTVYEKEQALIREKETNDSLRAAAEESYTKFTPDYVNNQEINILKEKIKQDTGEVVSDAELFDAGVMAPFTGARQIPKMIEQVDPATGKVVMDADGKTPLMVTAPIGKWGMEYTDDPTSLEAKERTVFQYKGKQYQVGSGFSQNTSALFNTMQSSYRRKTFQEKGDGGITDKMSAVNAKQKAETEAQAAAQAEANRTNEEQATAKESFDRGATVATNRVPAPTTQEKDVLGMSSFDRGVNYLFGDGNDKQTKLDRLAGKIAQLEGMAQDPTQLGARREINKTIIEKKKEFEELMGVPVTKELPTAIAAPQNIAQQPPAPATPQQQASLIKKQAQAAKTSQFLSKYQQGTKVVTPPVPQATQAAVSTASPYIPPKVTTDIPFSPDEEAINKVAYNPVFANTSGIFKAVVAHESRGVNEAVSPTGVTGVAQVTEATGKRFVPNFDRTNEVHQAIAGSAFMGELEGRYPNSPMLQLAAYNGGTVVVDEAVRLAKTTDWSVVKNYMEEAGYSVRAQTAWRRDFENAGLSEARIKKLLKTKPIETKNYAEKVIVNFPAFAFNADDNRVLNLLKQQGVFRT